MILSRTEEEQEKEEEVKKIKRIVTHSQTLKYCEKKKSFKWANATCLFEWTTEMVRQMIAGTENKNI